MKRGSREHRPLNLCASERTAHKAVSRKIQANERSVIEDPVENNIFALQFLHCSLHPFGILFEVVVAETFEGECRPLAAFHITWRDLEHIWHSLHDRIPWLKMAGIENSQIEAALFALVQSFMLASLQRNV
jgi:hypothetical protein